MKRSILLAAAVVVASIGLAGCAAEQVPERAEACADLSSSYGQALDSMQLGMSAGSAEGAGVHLEAVEDAIAASGEVGGPAEFVELRDRLLQDTQAFVDEGRVALDGGDSEVDSAQAELLESYAAVERYCAPE